METKTSTASFPGQARAWIVVGFAAAAIAAVINVKAFAGSPPAAASGVVVELPAPVAELSEQVDWARLPLSNITPAESVAAYDR